MAVFLSVLALAGLVILLYGGSKEAQGWTVSVEHDDVKLDVNPNSSGTNQNIVIIESEEIYSQTFEIQSTCGGSIKVTPNTATVSVAASGTVEQPLSISALPRSAFQQKDCMVTATRTHIAGISDPSRDSQNTGFKAIVLKFAEMNLTVEQKSYAIKEGEMVQLVFQLTNTGNFVDGFNLSLRGLPGGWNVDYLSNKGLMLPFENDTLIVNLTAHNAKTANLRLVAKSHYNDSVMFFAQVTVKVEAEDNWTWSLGVAVGVGAILVALAGSVVWRWRDGAVTKQKW